MMVLLKKNARQLGAGKILAMSVGCLVFSLACRVSCRLSYSQYLLSVSLDHYYLTYFCIPLVLLWSFAFIEDDGELVIGRFKSYASYFGEKWLGVSLFAGGIVLLQSVIFLLSGIGLPRNNVWTLPIGAVEAELFECLCRFFATPFRAFLAAAFFQFAGIWMVFGIAMWICHFAGRKWTVRILMLLYVFSALWVKTPALQHMPVTGLNHLVILHHNLVNDGRLWLTGGTVILLIFIIWLTVKFFWNGNSLRFLHRDSGILVYYFREIFSGKNLTIMLAVTAGMTFYKALQVPILEGGEDWIYFLFYGHGNGYFRLMPFLEILIVNGTPLYLLAAFVEKSVSGQSSFVIIRLKSRRELLGSILTVGVGCVLFYGFLWGAAAVLGGMKAGCAFDGGTVRLLAFAIVLKCLDILLQYLLMLVLYLCTGQVTIGFLALVGGNLLGILPAKIFSFLPFGLSGLARISVWDSCPGISPALAPGILTAGILTLSAWLLAIGPKCKIS